MISEDENSVVAFHDFEASSMSKRDDQCEAMTFPEKATATQLQTPMLFAATSGMNQVRAAYAQFKILAEGAAQSIESNGALLAAEIEEQQKRAIETIQSSVGAANDFVEAIRCATGPTATAEAQVEHFQRQRDVFISHMMEFIASAGAMIAVMTTPLKDAAQNCPSSASCPAGPCDDPSVAERLKSLTARQHKVLELLVDGLPNKVIAYELGISETTVKAHVGEILRKLCVYNRARAIAMLARLRLGAGGRGASAPL